MINKNCPKCKGEGYFKEYNPLTGNILKIPCLCIPEGLENNPLYFDEIAKVKAKQDLINLIKEKNNVL